MNAKQIQKKMKSLKWELDEVDKRVNFLISSFNEHRDGDTKLSHRAREGLIRAGAFYVFEIENLTLMELYTTWNVGKKTIDEITAWMKKHNLQFKNGNHG